MSYTFTVNTGDGTTTVFPFSFAGQDEGYLSVSNVQVFVAGTSVPFTIPTNDPNKVYLTSAPPVGAEVLIRRIMPKNVPYSDFSRGNPFSQDTLNDTNLQMLYVIQEILDGFLPDGFYLKGDLNMGGHKVVNMAPGSQDGDATNWEQLQEQVTWNNVQDSRLDSLETSLVLPDGSQLISYSMTAIGGELRWEPPTSTQFSRAEVYICGLKQIQTLGAYTISDNGVNFAEPLVAGWEVEITLIG
ncbi:tail fiber adaptor protein [Ralstonia phage Reminis]|uniref:Tail fiber adaptor protein n=1 Tax=Ralstonia phage Reminis TaxID=2662139 RepID=A0A5Q2U751_9CAUD|nr:tail fiber adaptor protein [Ralstonia phage Reminis]